VGREASPVSVYLEGGLPWLLDPDSDELRRIARGEPSHELGDDVPLLAQLLRERHFGVATGRVAFPEQALGAHGELAELQAALRSALVDQHFLFHRARNEPDDEGIAVERREVDGVLVLGIRRLMGDPADERALAAWVAGADRDFEHDRIVVDLRGNSGGNDGHTYDWAERRLRGVEGFVTSSTWCVRGTPLGYWNAAAWRQAKDGADAVPPSLLRGRHDPRPDDVLEVVDETHALPAGDRPWAGRMVVLVDGRTRSSGESSAWLLREALGARIAGEPTKGMIEYGNIVPYVLPSSGVVVHLPTKSNDYGFRVEGVGFPVDVELDPAVPADEVARAFDSFV
jgi:hypothetical protein